MSVVHQHAKHSHQLAVQGNGYIPPSQQPPANSRVSSAALNHTDKNMTSSTLRTAVSASNGRKKPPFVSACGGSSSALRRAGSTGNIPGATPSTSTTPTIPSRRIPLQLPQSQCGFLKRPKPQQERSNSMQAPSSGYTTTAEVVNCKCQHPADVSFLQDVYVQNLQTQIEVLELENNYLRGSRGSNGIIPPARSILKDESKMDREGAAMSFHPQPRPQHRVQFIDDNGGSAEESAPRGNAFALGNNGHILQQHHGSSYRSENLLLKLEQAGRTQLSLEASLKRQQAELAEMAENNSRLEDRLVAAQQALNKERRSLMEENVEMQRRLDELTPLFAEKETRIVRLEKERDALITESRTMEKDLKSMQARLNEQQKGESLMSELESEHRAEVERHKAELRQMARQLEESKKLEKKLSDELTFQQRLLADTENALKREEELKARDTLALRRENSELTKQTRRLEAELEQCQSERRTRLLVDPSAELRKEVNSLHEELARCEERLSREHGTVEQLRRQALERESKNQECRDSRLTRIQRELEGLQALSASLTEENKGLREEKISLRERVAQAEARLEARGGEISELRRRLEDFKQRHHNARHRLSSEAEKHEEMDKALDEIVHRFMQIIDPRHGLGSHSKDRRVMSASATLSSTREEVSSEAIRRPIASSTGYTSGAMYTSYETDQRRETPATGGYGKSSSTAISYQVLSPPVERRRIVQHSYSPHVAEAGADHLPRDEGSSSEMVAIVDESEVTDAAFHKFRRKIT